jgi:hypothetical protein
MGPDVTMKSSSDSGPLRSSLDQLRVSFNLSLTHTVHHHPSNLALCGSLVRVHVCVYTSGVILLFAGRKSSWTVFTSSPFAFSSVPKEMAERCANRCSWGCRHCEQPALDVALVLVASRANGGKLLRESTGLYKVDADAIGLKAG